jgi:hypothetical protein
MLSNNRRSGKRRLRPYGCDDPVAHCERIEQDSLRIPSAWQRSRNFYEDTHFTELLALKRAAYRLRRKLTCEGGGLIDIALDCVREELTTITNELVECWNLLRVRLAQSEEDERS